MKDIKITLNVLEVNKVVVKKSRIRSSFQAYFTLRLLEGSLISAIGYPLRLWSPPEVNELNHLEEISQPQVHDHGKRNKILHETRTKMQHIFVCSTMGEALEKSSNILTTNNTSPVLEVQNVSVLPLSLRHACHFLQYISLL